MYTDAGRREGLNVRAAYVHDLKAADRDPVYVSPEAIAASEQVVEDTMRPLEHHADRSLLELANSVS